MQDKHHRYLKWIFAFVVGFGLAFWAFDRATDPEPTRQKALQIAIVEEARIVLTSYVWPDGRLEYVDPIRPDRVVGKTYIWPDGDNWDISGYYRRDEDDDWHPFLMKLDPELRLISLAVKDTNERLIGLSSQDEKFSAVPE